jgi:hypothetical protein
MPGRPQGADHPARQCLRSGVPHSHNRRISG